MEIDTESNTNLESTLQGDNAIGLEVDTGSNRNPKLRQEVAAFRGFTVDRWCEWLNAFFSYEIDSPKPRSKPYEPELSVGPRELHFALISLYLSLESMADRNRLAEALACVFETTSFVKPNAALINHLLKVIAVAKSLRSKRLLRRTLFDDVLRDIYYNRENLHTLLLSVVGEFDVDEKLIDYLHRSADQTEDYSYLLTVFRLLAANAEDEAYTFIKRIVPHTKTDTDTDALNLALEIKAEFSRVGYQPFCEWYCNNAVTIGAEWPEEFGAFEEKMTQVFLTSHQTTFADEENVYLTMLWYQLGARKSEITAEKVKEIATLYRVLGIDTVVGALSNLKRRGIRWSYVSEYACFVADTYGGTSTKPSGRRIEIETDSGDIDEASFNRVDEPELDKIFESVKTYDVFEDAGPMKKTEGYDLTVSG